ncbi:MAG TPA: xanthine dehydrogenase family protein molybdopterin-binding subunit [Novosphingobium sp.]|nr:xanthine dehydrogenase family protein molybdopterin-binding subunit [Novosphingobium sp.]
MNAQRPGGFRHIGTRPVRPDGADKVTGRAIYSPDFVAAGMIHGAILRSPHAHARIRAIDTSRAEALPGVKAVVTGADFPTLESLIVAVGESAGNIVHASAKCMAKDKVLHEGQPVAAVAATTADIAREALALIAVDYEVLPHVLDIEAAMAPDAPVLHETVFTRGVEPAPERPSNAVQRFGVQRGDVAAALAGAAVVARGRYTLEPVHQGYIEPHACVAAWGADGQAQIWCSSQGHFAVRSLTASILAISQADIRVMPLEIGGGFGGKTTVYLEPVALLLSRKAGRPVRLAMSRADVFRASGPAPGGIVDIELGADDAGRFVACRIEMKLHTGAFPGNVIHSAVMSSIGHYVIPDHAVYGYDVLTNMPGCHAYRAPSAPQVNFAVESAIDEIALQLGIDAIDLRLNNAARPGDTGLMGAPLGEIGYVECLEAAKAHPHWSAPLGANEGRGVAGGYWGNYGGPSTATVSLAEDGTGVGANGRPAIGGSRASMALMAAEVLQVPYEKVRVTIADTSSIGYSMVTGGSRTTFATGQAVVNAAQDVVATLKARAAASWGVDPSAVDWCDGKAICQSGDKAGADLTIGAIAARAGFSGGPIAAECAINAQGYLPGYAVHICDTAVDPETGHVQVVRYTAVQDVGRAIHPDYVEGQIQGGAVQGIGWALNEAYVHDAQGRLDNAGFLDYRVPVCSDLPMIDPVMVEKPNPAHTFGVKGVGEVPIVPPLAAVASAVSRATGRRQRSLPLSPDRVWASLQD